MTEFDIIYRLYFTAVYRYMKKLSGNEKVAEEITSETFFKALQSIDGFRGDCDMRTWLCQIAKNCYFNYLRKQSRHTTLDELNVDAIQDYSSSAEEEYIVHSEASRARIAVHNLPEPYKEVFMLRAHGDLSFSEIARLFGKTQNWACVTYHRAKAKIKKQMEDEQHEE